MFTGFALFAPCVQSFYPSLWGVALPDGQGDVLIDDGGEIDGRVMTDGGDVEGEQRGKGLGEVEGDNREGVGGSLLASRVKRVPLVADMMMAPFHGPPVPWYPFHHGSRVTDNGK
ncbi:hypothetical protein [Escherichia fergusonii]|uniref:hypothetical protein n=1 Tax=Escherichia fergusonii TaxID=564 RepID=UPI001CBE04B6|nr:hypothetical protein [Escherichia fergusonii]